MINAVVVSLAAFQSTLPTRGSDRAEFIARAVADNFNPRSPRGGATRHICRLSRGGGNFNPRSPRGGATLVVQACKQLGIISIHAPHEGERLFTDFMPLQDKAKFQSTLPTRGSDLLQAAHRLQLKHFNPRSPRGGATITHITPMQL